MSFVIFGMSHKAGLCENKTQILKWSLGYICLFINIHFGCSFSQKCSQIIKEDILSKYRTSNEYCRRTIDMSLKSDKTDGSGISRYAMLPRNNLAMILSSKDRTGLRHNALKVS